jgi:hypothetical protein
MKSIKVVENQAPAELRSETIASPHVIGVIAR